VTGQGSNTTQAAEASVAMTSGLPTGTAIAAVGINLGASSISSGTVPVTLWIRTAGGTLGSTGLGFTAQPGTAQIATVTAPSPIPLNRGDRLFWACAVSAGQTFTLAINHLQVWYTTPASDTRRITSG